MAPNIPLPSGARFLSLPQVMTPGGTQQIADIDSSNVPFSPLQPLKPFVVAPVRQRQLTMGENLIWQPKGDGAYGFWLLREFADTCELMRAVIDTLEDRLCNIEFEFRVKQQPGEPNAKYDKRQASDSRLSKLSEMFKKPDGVWPWKKWLRMLIEDGLVIDAQCIYKERDLKRRIASLRVIDGATVNRCVTEQGFLPPPPSVAYQQIMYGLIWADMTTDDLTYIMRNPRSWKRYGYSVVEQCLTHLVIAIRQQSFVEKYFTDGNMPEALCFLPSDLPIDRVREIQGYIDSILAGDLSKRRRLTFLPGYGGSGSNTKPNIIFPKEVLLKDPLMDWLFQLFCYKVGVSPQAMLRMMNRATAATSQETSEEEGLEPKIGEVQDMIDSIVQDDLGYKDIEFRARQRRETDILKQAQVDQIYVNAGIKWRNEIRENLGLDADPSPQASQLTITTASGVVPVDADDALEIQQNKQEALQPGEPMPSSNGNGKNKPKPAATPKKKVSKRLGARISPGELTATSLRAKAHVHASVLKIFRRQKDKAKDEARRLLKANRPQLAKGEREFDSVQFNLSQQDCDKVLGIHVAPQDFSEKGRETEPHVTVLFGYQDCTPAEISYITRDYGDVEIELGDLITFDGDGTCEPLVIEVLSDRLVDLHNALAILPHTDTHPNYVPHICVGYLNPGKAEKYVEQGNPLKGEKMTLANLVFSGRDHTSTALLKGRRWTRLSKDSPNPEDDGTVDEVAAAIYAEVAQEWDYLPSQIRASLEDSARSGIGTGALQIDYADDSLIADANTIAEEYARGRAAELVGMKYDDDGNLVENPDARWAISETTRDKIRSIVSDAFKQSTDMADIRAAVLEALEQDGTGIFSDARADMIAQTEVANAQISSNFEVWRQSGVVEEIDWLISADHDSEDICDDLADGGPYSIGDCPIPGFDSHPLCTCTLVVSKVREPVEA